MKILVARGKPVEIAGSRWKPEHWRKTAKVDPDLIDHGMWVSVEKRIWRRPGIEVCHIEIAGTTWWSLAVKVRGGTPAPLNQKLVRHLSTVGDELLCCGYPEWLLLQLGGLPAANANANAGAVTTPTPPGRQLGDRSTVDGRSKPPSPGR